MLGRGGMRGDVPGGGALGSGPIVLVCQIDCAPAELGLILCLRPLKLLDAPMGELSACEGPRGALLRCAFCCGFLGSPTARAALPNVPPLPPSQALKYFAPLFVPLLPPSPPLASRIAPAMLRFVLSIIVPPIFTTASCFYSLLPNAASTV